LSIKIKEQAMKTLDFGKHEGEKLAECPVSYIKWLATHKAVLAERNRWASRLAKKLLQEKEMSYQVGQAVKIVDAIGGTVCATVVSVNDEKISATLLHTGGTYEYDNESLAPATEQDLADAKRWHERNVSIFGGVRPLSHMDVPADFGMFDEDGVRIA